MKRKFRDSKVEAYRRHGHRLVSGWLSPIDADVVVSIGDAQTKAGITGAVGEIGVHHGRLAIQMYLLLHEGERGFCIDIFDRQDMNPDQSGYGDKAIFLDNLSRAGIPHECVHIIAKSSDRVAPEEITDTVGRVRLFSVDGGHTADLTESDMILASRTLTDDGVIILDDYFNKNWPGVSEGAYRVLSGGSLVPFAVSVNKVLLCRPAFHRFYLDHARSHRLFFKDSILFGKDVAIIGLSEPTEIKPSLAWFYRSWEWARPLRHYANRVAWLLYKAA